MVATNRNCVFLRHGSKKNICGWSWPQARNLLQLGCLSQAGRRFQGARYKSFASEQEAVQALEAGPDNFKEKQQIKNFKSLSNPPQGSSICVDAACSGNPGKMEYRGVFTETNTELFKSKVYEQGTII